MPTTVNLSYDYYSGQKYLLLFNSVKKHMNKLQIQHKPCLYNNFVQKNYNINRLFTFFVHPSNIYIYKHTLKMIYKINCNQKQYLQE